ncbi:hypothetical protein [Microvirga solisilvae]|uniref:hypothetical protein n=1 Tax=Microvirga solisilvae TaxID=2919498 RepID=UPI001FAF65CC|nr:hypothetical protein [Microvirga solisilvae]
MTSIRYTVHIGAEGDICAVAPVCSASDLTLARAAYERAARVYPWIKVSLHGPTGIIASTSPAGRTEVVNGATFSLPPMSSLAS